jgi:hypothetical protein
MFPLDISGSIRLRDLGNPVRFSKPVTERIVDMLDEAGASEVWLEGDAVHFKSGLFSGGSRGNWNILGPFNSGTIRTEIEDTSLRVRYRLSTLHMFLTITAMLGALFGIVISSSIAHGGDWQSLARVCGFGWLWLFGMNYLTGMIRIPYWLRRGLRNIAK